LSSLQRFRFTAAWGLACASRRLLTLMRGPNAGTSLPGKLAQRVCPDALAVLGKRLDPTTELIAVTGTNGKTTTSGLLAHGLKEIAPGARLIHNTLGANMLNGVLGLMMDNVTPGGRLKADTVLLELDEASAKAVVSHLPLKRLLVTNLFRDQLDRYGELDTTAQLITRCFPHVQEALYLNADDPLVAAMAGVVDTLPEATRPRVVFYGLEGSSAPRNDWHEAHPIPFPVEGADCPKCGEVLHYTERFFGQLGHYACEVCGFRRPQPHITGWVEKIGSEGDAQLRLNDQVAHTTQVVTSPLPGMFNLYNVLAASSVLMDKHRTQPALANLWTTLGQLPRVFGRAERRTLHGHPVMVFLMKNPVGASEVLHLVARMPDVSLLLALNDKAADGKDVSWIWDAPFEVLADPRSTLHRNTLTVSGVRADDLALRLHYAGFSPEQLQIEKPLDLAVEKALARLHPGQTLVCILTYTVLLHFTDHFKPSH
jgi:lipid II isoglutaminyl synthase (glutamine-hydrolysing)